AGPSGTTVRLLRQSFYYMVHENQRLKKSPLQLQLFFSLVLKNAKKTTGHSALPR
ncbi:MAG: hypothetical protein ACI94D_000938, partial [Neolewinella sp.]